MRVCVCVYMRVCVWLCVCVSVVVVVAVAVVVVDTNACIEYGCSCLCRTKDKHASSCLFKVGPCFQLCHGPHQCHSIVAHENVLGTIIFCAVYCTMPDGHSQNRYTRLYPFDIELAEE